MKYQVTFSDGTIKLCSTITDALAECMGAGLFWTEGDGNTATATSGNVYAYRNGAEAALDPGHFHPGATITVVTVH